MFTFSHLMSYILFTAALIWTFVALASTMKTNVLFSSIFWFADSVVNGNFNTCLRKREREENDGLVQIESESGKLVGGSERESKRGGAFVQYKLRVRKPHRKMRVVNQSGSPFRDSSLLILTLPSRETTVAYLELIELLRRRYRNSRVLRRARIFQRSRSVKSWRKSLLEKLPFRALLHVLGCFGRFAHFFVC